MLENVKLRTKTTEVALLLMLSCYKQTVRTLIILTWSLLEIIGYWDRALVVALDRVRPVLG